MKEYKSSPNKHSDTLFLLRALKRIDNETVNETDIVCINPAKIQ